jgi:hypothetical protein
MLVPLCGMPVVADEDTAVVAASESLVAERTLVYGAVEVRPEALLRSALTEWVVPEGPLPPGSHPVADAEAERLTSH